jgi:hypothetical protein
MKDVVIDNSQELVMVDGKVIPRMLLHMIRGGVGKSFVVKRYRGGRMVVTHFPDMSGVMVTEKQRVRRDLFREAVVFAKWIIADEERKLAFRNTLPRKKRKKVYQAALQMYIKEKGNKQWLRKVLGMLEVQGAKVCVGFSRQLAVIAVIESDKCELIKRKGGYEQQGQWREMWRKKLNRETMLECIDNIALLATCSPAFTK